MPDRIHTLRDFDLQVVRVRQIVARYAKPAGRDLLDGRAGRGGSGLSAALRVLPALCTEGRVGWGGVG